MRQIPTSREPGSALGLPGIEKNSVRAIRPTSRKSAANVRNAWYRDGVLKQSQSLTVDRQTMTFNSSFRLYKLERSLPKGQKSSSCSQTLLSCQVGTRLCYCKRNENVDVVLVESSEYSTSTASLVHIYIGQQR